VHIHAFKVEPFFLLGRERAYQKNAFVRLPMECKSIDRIDHRQQNKVVRTCDFPLKPAHIVAGEFRYIGKETDHKWEESDDLSVLEFKTTEYGRAKKVVATPSIADEIRDIGLRKTIELTKMSQHTIEKLLRGEAVKRKTHEQVLRAIQAHKNPQLTG
jgi:hypothetical protein